MKKFFPLIGSHYVPGRCQPICGRDCFLEVDVPIKNPDQALYSQKEEIAGGFGPTWDRPDLPSHWQESYKRNKWDRFLISLLFAIHLGHRIDTVKQ